MSAAIKARIEYKGDSQGNVRLDTEGLSLINCRRCSYLFIFVSYVTTQ
jgi:hypothetical protein